MAAPRPAHRTAAVTLGALALAVGVGGCTSTSVLTLGVGDCLHSADLERGESVSDVATVPCEEPHDAEIFAATTLPAGDYPGLESLRTEAENYCLPEFETFAGLPYLSSELDVYPLLPTSDSWEQEGDRTILCIAVAPEDVTGTLEGAQR